MEIELSEKEMTIILQLVEAELAELNPEIRHSATSAMRERLRDERTVLRGLYDRLQLIEMRHGAAANW